MAFHLYCAKPHRTDPEKNLKLFYTIEMLFLNTSVFREIIVYWYFITLPSVDTWEKLYNHWFWVQTLPTSLISSIALDNSFFLSLSYRYTQCVAWTHNPKSWCSSNWASQAAQPWTTHLPTLNLALFINRELLPTSRECQEVK